MSLKHQPISVTNKKKKNYYSPTSKNLRTISAVAIADALWASEAPLKSNNPKDKPNYTKKELSLLQAERHGAATVQPGA